MNNLKIKECKPIVVNIYIAGNIDKAKDILSKYCYENGLCVTLNSLCYIYTGGVEYGMEISLRNYPRFEDTYENIIKKSIVIAKILICELYQTSCMICSDKTHIWINSGD